MLNELELKNPQVYIHTGNWVFASESAAVDMRFLISESIKNSYGWEVPIVVFAALEFQEIIENYPFFKEKKSYFTLLSEVPTKENRVLLNEVFYPDEEFHLDQRCVYFYSTNSAARVKINNNFIERKLKVSATSRNYKTMAKLIKLSEATV